MASNAPINPLIYTLIPVAATIAGSAVAIWRSPGPRLTSALQHFAAGVVFAAAAGEILPDLKHKQSVVAVAAGGLLAVVVMLMVKALGERMKGTGGLVTIVAVDILIDGLVLGIGFAAGVTQGLLLTVALTIEVLFLGLSITPGLKATIRSSAKVVAITSAIALLLPFGAALGNMLQGLPDNYLAGFFAFALIALLYLVTEELLVEAHEVPETPWITAMFFVGFLLLLMIEEVTGSGP